MSWYLENSGDGKGVYVEHVGENTCAQYFSNADMEKASALCNYLNGGDGLTKRERFALTLQSAFIAGHGDTYVDPGVGVEAADLLIAELEKTA